MRVAGYYHNQVWRLDTITGAYAVKRLTWAPSAEAIEIERRALAAGGTAPPARARDGHRPPHGRAGRGGGARAPLAGRPRARHRRPHPRTVPPHGRPAGHRPPHRLQRPAWPRCRLARPTRPRRRLRRPGRPRCRRRWRARPRRRRRRRARHRRRRRRSARRRFRGG
ncbi:hypothetical protein [Nonomuraea dietziae]|uniref:hypothetical protein n=1 Tax=Nonomuraea dietziae TaxID=65515 RepID=UPI0031D7C67E